MPRLFTAIRVPEDIALELNFKQSGLHGARWLDGQDFHITLRFIGDVEQDIADTLQAEFSKIDKATFPLSLMGMGSFGKKKPRSLWAGVSESKALVALNKSHETICRKCGLAPETRNFLPHVTLARLKGAKLNDVELYKERQNLYRSEKFMVENFCLLSSRPSKGGGPYLTVEKYDLGVSG